MDGDGVEYEPDQRHAELVVKELELEGAKPVTSPWTSVEKGIGQEQSPLLMAQDGTKYRALVARMNYLAQDRPDLQYATKEESRRMSAPRESDWTALKRVG